MNITQRYDR